MAFSEVRWKMMGAVALIGVAVLLLAFRYVPATGGSAASQDGGPVAMQSVQPISSTGGGPWSVASTAVAPSGGGSISRLPAQDILLMENPKGTVLGMDFLDVALRSTVGATDTAANGSGLLRYEIATIKIHVESGSLDYGPQTFTFIASDGHTYQPSGASDALAATSTPLGAGHLLAGQAVTGDLVFVVPAGKGKLQLSGIAAQDLPSWPATV